MAYVSFISDEDLLRCIRELHQSYERCKRNSTVDKFYSNKVDPIKFQFDMAFNDIDEESYIKSEIARQDDKTISNAIGVFQQSLLGCIDGINDLGVGNGCDISNVAGTIFAEVKNKHNTMNSSSAEATFQKLQAVADSHPNATCYLVQIIAKNSIDELWEGSFNHKYYSHPRVRIISGDRFYALLTGISDAFHQLCEAIPRATQNYLNSIATSSATRTANVSVYSQLDINAQRYNRTLLEQIMADNFSTYIGF
mgnify:CR=1 FL=1